MLMAQHTFNSGRSLLLSRDDIFIQEWNCCNPLSLPRDLLAFICSIEDMSRADD